MIESPPQQSALTENQPPSQDQKKVEVPRINFSKAKSLLTGSKKVKILTLSILLFTSLVVILGLNLMSQKKQEETVIPQAEIPSASPQPSADTNLENISGKVKAYNNKLDQLGNYQKKLTYPIVELDISFPE